MQQNEASPTFLNFPQQKEGQPDAGSPDELFRQEKERLEKRKQGGKDEPMPAPTPSSSSAPTPTQPTTEASTVEDDSKSNFLNLVSLLIRGCVSLE